MYLLYRYKYLALSLSLHIAIVLLGLFYAYDFLSHKKAGVLDGQVMEAYIYKNHQSQSTANQIQRQQSGNVSPKKIINTHVDHADLVINRSNKHEDISQKKLSIPAETMSAGESVVSFLARLHDAIQRKQVYPPSALEMGRQGRVTVDFTLYLDGHVEQLRVVSSSGTASLDRAALQAVKDASPFINLADSIKSIQQYQIDITFELA